MNRGEDRIRQPGIVDGNSDFDPGGSYPDEFAESIFGSVIPAPIEGISSTKVVRSLQYPHPGSVRLASQQPPMQSISRSALRFCSHRCAAGCCVAWYPAGLARRAPLNPAAAALALQEKPPGRLPRFAYESLVLYHGIGFLREEISDALGMKSTAIDRIWHACNFKNSTHRDGAIYKRDWSDYLMDMDDRNETVSELETSSKGPCYPDEENCAEHPPSPMIQIFSLRLAKTPVNSGSIQLYGYMAARDDVDGLLNYVFNRSRDNPIIVQQGSLLEMTGPRRGILMLSDVLIEFDMRIKTGEKEEDDLQLIDGVEHLSQRIPTRPFTLRFNGGCGTVDMCLTFVEAGMEAAIEVAISEVRTPFDLSLSSIVFTEELKEFQLFHGAVGELGTKRRYVVAVPAGSVMHLKFKVGEKGSGDSVHCCSFDSNQHGEIKLAMASMSVKVTVSPPWL